MYVCHVMRPKNKIHSFIVCLPGGHVSWKYFEKWLLSKMNIGSILWQTAEYYNWHNN